jgi:hypothetical protein
MPTEFVHKQNIERYRKLLLEETTDEVRRLQILQLLAEEEAKDQPPRKG